VHHRRVLFSGNFLRGEIPQAKSVGCLRGNFVGRPSSLVLFPKESHLMDGFLEIFGAEARLDGFSIQSTPV
jgi:hypothetical protein